MPAILTHDFFGRDVYDDLHGIIGDTKDEFDSFLLGCQGPDVMFFSQLNPTQSTSWGVGTKMHRSDPVALFTAFQKTISSMPADSYSVGRSYLLGLVCHYILDKNMHPFIYAQQFAIADAGIEGLDRTHGHEIHAEIESELDVLVLSTKLNETISNYDPEKKTLRVSKAAARVISRIYKEVASQDPIRRGINDDAFASALSSYRLALGAMHSPTGVKRSVLGALERLFKDHSFIQAMSHRNALIFESDFDNRNRDPWTDPWTKDVKSTGFWDIYHSSLSQAKAIMPLLDPNDGEACNAIFETMTAGRDFNGSPTRAMLIEVEDI